ncbi:hypothetical protein A2954_07665 [Candidatus Roizmanbacteria bacterium RIFCSPLOWO2_01_FULL_37_12]|uniref:Fimbrial assembly protein n=1 Tax=Candidatus Roizmanbacteria bacterium RIFCSPLOWO2_01_FULL_37_12 TaxID=1802056 RepID=A0A1F7I832_9BACT|nr:MAG: hypothetical protein A3D76_01570 [Candidatus Roizmanbacteria bacterium RIFCSPHIGHO2_02_FULL_37_9b]OGK39531.1 MAG: hypothetical protein A2954_07665 [Candidatus Roizmanbacteria bacterium RIFCSPLOWO2_01_FULL_37_12]
MKYKINLISQKKEKSVDKIIYFVLNYLRYILVITQIIVIGVFFYRFKIDQEMVDLQEGVAQKKEIILVSQPLIKEAKKQALRLDEARSIVAKQTTFLAAMDYLLSLFPENLYLTKIRLAKNSISMVGYTQDPQSINNFLGKLKNEGKFKKILLKNIKKGEQGMEFTFEFSSYKISQPI